MSTDRGGSPAGVDGDRIPREPLDFSLVLGGPLFQLLRRAHLADDAPGAPAIDYAKISLMPPGQLQALSDAVQASDVHLFDVRPVRLTWQAGREVPPQPPRGRCGHSPRRRGTIGEYERSTWAHRLTGQFSFPPWRAVGPHRCTSSW